LTIKEILSSNIEFLRVKIRIAALLDLVFQRNKNERVLSYKDICNACSCKMEDVELLTMKALNLQLLNGYIDEVKIAINK